MVDYVHRFLPVFASLILSGHLVGCAGVSPKVDAGSTVSVMFPAPPPDAALAPAPVAVPAPAAPGVEGPPSTDAVLVNGKPVSGTEIIGEWKRMDGPRSCWLGKQADGASQIKCYPSVRRSRVGRSNFSANRRATTASLGYRAFSVKTVCFGSNSDLSRIDMLPSWLISTRGIFTSQAVAILLQWTTAPFAVSNVKGQQ